VIQLRMNRLAIAARFIAREDSNPNVRIKSQPFRCQEPANLAKGFENGFGVLVLAKQLYPEIFHRRISKRTLPQSRQGGVDLGKKQNEGCYILNKCKR
jgi:hypothetical protein